MLTDPTAGQQALDLLPQVLSTGSTVAVVVLLLGVARTVRAGDPFAPANRRRLLWVAGLVAVGGTVVQVVGDLVRNTVAEEVFAVQGSPSATFGLSLVPLIVGLMIAFFAEVSRRGAQLRADVDGLL